MRIFACYCCLKLSTMSLRSRFAVSNFVFCCYNSSFVILSSYMVISICACWFSSAAVLDMLDAALSISFPFISSCACIWLANLLGASSRRRRVSTPTVCACVIGQIDTCRRISPFISGPLVILRSTVSRILPTYYDNSKSLSPRSTFDRPEPEYSDNDDLFYW